MTLYYFRLILVLFIIFPVTSFSKNSTTTSLKIQLSGDGKKPFLVESSASSLLPFWNAVFSQLLFITPTYDLEPGIISKWNWDFDNEVYLLTLKENLIFHNGRYANAEDLEFSLLRGFFTKKRLYTTAFLSNIEGVDQITAGQPYKTGLVKGVRVLAKNKLSIKLKAPNPSFLYTLARSTQSLVPREELHDDLVTWKQFPVGTGDYKVIFSDPRSSKVHLKKTDVLKAYLPDEIEWATEDVFGGRADIYSSAVNILPIKDMKKVSFKIPKFVGMYFFNYAHPLGKNKLFRQSIAQSVQRANLDKENSDITPLAQLLPQHYWGRAKPIEKFDPKKAKVAIAALFPDPKDRKVMTPPAELVV